MNNYLLLMRPKNWIKNFIIFIPLFFNTSFTETKFLILLGGFVSFSLLASSIYIINDIFDLESDKKHKEKKNRPLAAGLIKTKNAKIFSLILMFTALVVNYLIRKNFFSFSTYILILYIILNILYSKKLKEVPIFDIFILACFYLIRLSYGSLLVNVPVSNFLFLTVLSVTLLLGINKRRLELYKDNVRIVLKRYSKNYLEKFETVFLALTITFYSLWVMKMDNSNLYLSIPLIIFILMEYIFVSEDEESSDPTTVFFKSKVLIVLSIIYVCYLTFILY